MIVNPVALKQARQKNSDTGSYAQLRNLTGRSEIFSLGDAQGIASSGKSANAVWSEESRDGAVNDEVHVSERASMRLAKPQGLWEVQSHTILEKLNAGNVSPEIYRRAAGLSVRQSMYSLNQTQYSSLLSTERLDIYA